MTTRIITDPEPKPNPNDYRQHGEPPADYTRRMLTTTRAKLDNPNR
jgi:hypothetical protein